MLTQLKDLTFQLKDYLEARKDLLLLQAADKTASVLSLLVSWIVIGICLFVVALLAAVTLGLLISELTGNYVIGFASVTLLYLLITLLIYAKRHAWIKLPVMNAFIKQLFKDQN